VGNCADIIPELTSRGVLPDILTYQTSAHNLLNGYLPSSLNAEEASALRNKHPEEYLSRAQDSLARHFEGMLALQKMGSIVFEFGNSIRTAAVECGVQDAASAFPGFVEAYLQPMLSAGLAPVRWIALSGEAADIRRLDDLALELFPDDALLARWIPLARKFVRFQGLPARVCWMGNDARIALAGRVNQLVAEGTFQAPLVIVVDHASGSAGPTAEKEEILPFGNSPAVRRLLNAASGASWLSLEVGAGSSQATVALVADGSPQAAKNIPHALEDDSALKILQLVARQV